MRSSASSLLRRFRAVLIALVLAMIQLTPALAMQPQVASAAVNECIQDTAGANDEPNQKDLTYLCVDDSGLPNTILVSWNWDDRGTSGGGQSMDGCALFDTDNDGNANYSVCVATVNKEPALFQSLTIYSCGDARPDRCTSPATALPGPYSPSTDCDNVSEQNTDPFAGGDFSPIDTVSNCTVALADVGGHVASLIDVCSYPSGQPNSDPSDCVILRDNSAKIEIIKQINPETDPGLFNLQLNSVTKLTDASDGDSTGEIVVDSDNNGESFTVGETAGTGTSLATYTSAVECRDLNGTGQIVGSSQTTSATFTVLPLQDIVCTITNTRQQGTLKVIKDVVNGNGGTKTSADFTFTVNGGGAQTFVPTTGPDGDRVLTLPTGIYTVVEPEANTMGYSTSYSNCTNVSVVNGQQAVCTITNNDVAGKIRVYKNVTNNNGGNAVAADFTLSINGTARTQGQYYNYDVGTYTVTENNVTGYSQTGITCVDDNTQQTLAHPVSLSLAQSVTCTVYNDDVAPGLTVVKNVTNDNGGSAKANNFTLRLNGNALTSPVISNGDLTATYSPVVSSNTVYTVSEDAYTGYTGSSVACVNTGTQQSVGHPVTLNEGQNVTCTIMNNDDTPALTLIKNLVDYYNSGYATSSWTLTADGPTDLSGTSGVKSDATFDAGSYTLGETGPTSGIVSSTWECKDKNGATVSTSTLLTVNLGDDITCNVTNTTQQPKVVVTKHVVDNYGGGKPADEFTLQVNGSDVTLTPGNTGTANFQEFSGNESGTNVYLDAGNYDVSEGNYPGYETSYSGDCDDMISIGETKYCTVTNTAKAPELTVIKRVENNNGGTLTSSAFTMLVSGTNVSDDSFAGADTPGTTVTLSAGSYEVSEQAVDGYTAEYSADCKGSIALGEKKTCTVTNRDNTPALTLVKSLVDYYNSGYTADSWTLSATGPTGFSGTSGVTSDAAFDAGDYTLNETGPTQGVSASEWSCTEGYNDSSDVLTVELGDSITCTITNTTVQPKLTVIKHVVDNYGGSKEADDFDMTVTGKDVTLTAGNSGLAVSQTFDGSESGTDVYLDAGSYKVTEDEQKGYAVDYSADCESAIEVGDHKTCTITNTAIQPKLTLVKTFKGQGNPDDFAPTVNDSDSTWGTHLLNVGSYEVDEKAPIKEGYKLRSISCYDTNSWESVSNPVELGLGDDVTCNVKNEQLGRVIVTKYYDLNENGVRDEYFGELEPTLEGFEMNLSGESTESVTTDEYGVADFGYMSKGEYELWETVPEDWRLTNISCDYEDEQSEGYSDGYNSYYLYVSRGETVNCEVGNARTTMDIVVDKTNYTNGAQVPVDTVVTYTITVTNPAKNAILHNPVVVDTPPTGFTYVSGSWVASSMYRGDLKDQGIVLEPIFDATKGTWTFDGLTEADDVLYPGEVVYLTYQMKIGSGVTPGVKTNTAVAEACTQRLIVREVFDILSIRSQESDIALPTQEEEDCVSDSDTSDVNVKGVTIVSSGLVDTGAPTLHTSVFGLALAMMAIYTVKISKAKK